MSEPNYTIIDLEYLNEMADGNEGFVQEILEDYLVKTPESLNELISAKASDDFDLIHLYSHKLKSSFQFVGAKVLLQLASDIEHKAIGKSGLEEIQTMLDQLISLSREADQELKKELARISGK